MSKSDYTENKTLVDLSKNVLCGSCYKEFTTVDSDQNLKVWQFMRDYLLFGKMLNLLGQIF